MVLTHSLGKLGFERDNREHNVRKIKLKKKREREEGEKKKKSHECRLKLKSWL